VSESANTLGLLERLRAGDPDAKDALIARTYDRLMVLARKYLKGFPDARIVEDTEGVLHESYVKHLNKALDDVRPSTHAQFFGLAALQIRRTLIEIIRRVRGRGAKPRPLKVDSRDADGIGPGEHEPAVDSGSSQNDRQIDVLEAIDKLPDELRDVVNLHMFIGLTLTEVAELLGVTVVIVKYRWTAACEKLGEFLAHYVPSEAPPE
jgi:RNA polymerase sigma-70 factor (ECF subfamily)